MFKIVGQGTVRKVIATQARPTELVFTNALHTPDLAANLISIACFDKAGFLVTFSKGRAVFKDQSGREVLTGNSRNGMYHLNMLDRDTHPRIKAMVAASLNCPVDLDGWHQRFGHAEVNTIRSLVNGDLVDGLTIQRDAEAKGLCEDCVYRKHNVRPYDGHTDIEKHANECAHIDLWGPASVQSLGGAQYLMLIVDGGTSCLTGYFLTQKSAEPSQPTISNLSDKLSANY